MSVHPRSAPRRATLRDVARTAGVSLKTASNVLNDNGRSYAPTIGGLARFLNEVRTVLETRDWDAELA